MIITLINPPVLMRKGNAATVTPSPPLGLAYVASYIRTFYQVEIVDSMGEALDQVTDIKNSPYFFHGLQTNEIIARINLKSRIIGLSCMFTSNWLLHKEIVRKAIATFPEALIVLGGEHATAAHENILREFPENLVCVLGEGEETLLDLCQQLEKVDGDFKNVRGIAYYDKERGVISSRRERIKALDEIPTPAWDLFPIEKYLQQGSGATVHNRRTMMMLTSRGCPYKCSFCSAPQMWDKYVFHRAPEAIILEIRNYISLYKIDHIEFMDLVGLVNKKWTLDFCEKMAQANLPVTITFSPGTRSEILSEEILRGLKAAKLLRIQYAPDSGSTEEAKLLKKNANLDKMTISMAKSVELDLPICSNILVGYPGQRLRDLYRTGKFCLKLARLGVDDVLVHNFVPYDGSEFHEKLINDPKKRYIKYIGDTFMTRTTGPSLGYVQSFSENIPSWFLSIFRFTVLGACVIVHYLFHPKRIFKSIKNVTNKLPVTYLENLLYLKFYREVREIKKMEAISIESFKGIG